MSPDPRPTPVQSAADVNAAIRALVKDAARRRVRLDAGRYQRLVVEWAEAVRAEAELAA